MKNYSVKEIAELLGTNPETVRRWIRDGKLTAKRGSRKEGNVVTEDELQKFLKAHAKYGGIAASSMVMSPLAGIGGVAVALGGLVGTLIVDQVTKEKVKTEAKLNPSEVQQLIQEEIKKRQANIERKKLSISELEMEIVEIKEQIDALKATEKALREKLDD